MLPCGKGIPTHVRGGQTHPTRHWQGSVTWAGAPVSIVGTVEASAQPRALGVQSARLPRRATGASSPRVGGGVDGDPRAGPRRC